MLIFNKLLNKILKIRGFEVPAKLKLPLRVLGFALLIAGCVWSVSNLNLALHDISPIPFLLNLILLAPINLLIAAITLKLSAQALNKVLSTRVAIGAVAKANVAELLPLPGGAIVRGAALMKTGASLSNSAAIVTITALLTLGMTIVFSALALVVLGQKTGVILILIGLIGTIFTSYLILRRAGITTTLKIILIRIVTLFIGLATLTTSFATIGSNASLIEVALLTVSTTLGSTVSIIPAGLGVNEAIAAALASLVSIAPAAAFLAVALNRTTGLIAGAVLTILFPVKDKTS